MYRYLSLLLFFCGFAVFAENPMNFREYTQEVTAEFATPDEARRATAEISKMPNGEELAFTSRWDDSNTNNVNMSATLKKSGIKGTFFLTSASDRYYKEYGSKLLADGNSVGAHSMHHPILSSRHPAHISSQVMLIRPLLEKKAILPAPAPLTRRDLALRKIVKKHALILAILLTAADRQISRRDTHRQAAEQHQTAKKESQYFRRHAITSFRHSRISPF